MKIQRSQLKELVRQAIEELKEGGPGSGRPTKPGSKRDVEKRMDKAVSDANAKLDAAEKAAKAKKKVKEDKGDMDNDGKNEPDSEEYLQNKDKAIKKAMKNESKVRRFTVKEVRMWMKTLEENRYKKVYNSDARRVAWMVNNEGVKLQEMPESMRKKWTKAEYGRERYLAKEFLKSQKQKMTEIALRNTIRNKILQTIN